MAPSAWQAASTGAIQNAARVAEVGPAVIDIGVR
jgi:hypothetical protein